MAEADFLLFMILLKNDKIRKEIGKYKISFFSTFFIGLTTYFPIAMYLPYNSDILSIAENKNSYNHYIFTLGRLARALFEKISNFFGFNITVPVFQVVIGLFIFGICILIIAYVFKIKNVISQLLLGGIIVLSCYSEMFLFVHDIIAYSISIFLSLLALVLVLKIVNMKNTNLLDIIISTFIAILILSLSVSIYQISIIYFLAIYCLVIIQNIYENQSYKKIIKSLIVTFIICLIVFLIYIVSVKIVHSNVLSIRGGFAGLDKLFKVYGSIVLLPFMTYAGINYSIIVKISIALIYIYIMIFLIKVWLRAEKINKFILLLIVILFPIIINIAMLLESRTSFRTLQGMIFIIIVPLWIFNNTTVLSKWKRMIFIPLLLVLFFNFYYTECRILAEKNACESTKAYLIEMVSKIKGLENYNPNNKVALMTNTGKFNMENLLDYSSYSSYYGNPTNKSCLLTSWGINEAFKVFAGYDIKLVNQEEKEKIRESKEYNNMKNYPYFNSIKIINGIIVIKLD